MRYYYTYTREAKIKKKKKLSSIGADVEQLGTHTLLVRVWNAATTMGEQYGTFL